MRLGVVLFNLGGPDTLDAVQPFLRNLFSDPAIIRAPAFVRWPLARLIAWRRRDYAQRIYASIGGGSPIVPETMAQATALEAALAAAGHDAKVVIAMRYWKPHAAEAAAALAAFAPDRLALIPLYPQFSTTTTASSLADWDEAAARARLTVRSAAICCYPLSPGFVSGYADLLQAALRDVPEGKTPHILFSAHGLPERIVEAGDPYPTQIEASALAVARAAGVEAMAWRVTYQSRVGPLKWIGPDTDNVIVEVSRAGQVPVVVPLSFVSEHSETLYELDQLYRETAMQAGAPAYIRVPALGAHPDFIAGLAGLVSQTLVASTIGPEPSWPGCGAARGCPCVQRSAA